jgi:hypothetical protein
MDEKGETRSEAHVLGVIVRDQHGKEIARWYEVSELGVGTPDAKLLGHTEQKALTRIGEMNPKPGWRIIFVGHLQPCNLSGGCSTVMKDFANSTGATIDYRHVHGEDGSTLHEFDPDDGRITKKDREDWRKNN